MSFIFALIGSFFLITIQAGTFVSLRSRGVYGNYDIGESAFNTLFEQNPSFVGTYGTIIRRECASCDVSHQDIYYVRLTSVPGTLNMYQVFLNDWFDTNNVNGTDFNLYSSLTEAISDVNAWTHCNFDDPTVGFPRDCGPTSTLGGQWNSFSSAPDHGLGELDVRFSLYAPNDFVNVLSKGSYGNYDIGAFAFNSIFQGSRAHVIRRECQNCLNSHKIIYYRRLTDVNTFAPYLYMKDDWSNTDNVRNTDFNLFNTLQGARNNEVLGRWEICYYSVPGNIVGFPRDCAPVYGANNVNQWNEWDNLPGVPGGQPNVRFSIYVGN